MTHCSDSQNDFKENIETTEGYDNGYNTFSMLYQLSEAEQNSYIEENAPKTIQQEETHHVRFAEAPGAIDDDMSEVRDEEQAQDQEYKEDFDVDGKHPKKGYPYQNTGGREGFDDKKTKSKTKDDSMLYYLKKKFNDIKKFIMEHYILSSLVLVALLVGVYFYMKQSSLKSMSSGISFIQVRSNPRSYLDSTSSFIGSSSLGQNYLKTML